MRYTPLLTGAALALTVAGGSEIRMWSMARSCVSMMDAVSIGVPSRRGRCHGHGEANVSAAPHRRHSIPHTSIGTKNNRNGNTFEHNNQ